MTEVVVDDGCICTCRESSTRVPLQNVVLLHVLLGLATVLACCVCPRCHQSLAVLIRASGLSVGSIRRSTFVSVTVLPVGLVVSSAQVLEPEALSVAASVGDEFACILRIEVSKYDVVHVPLEGPVLDVLHRSEVWRT